MPRSERATKSLLYDAPARPMNRSRFPFSSQQIVATSVGSLSIVAVTAWRARDRPRTVADVQCGATRDSEAGRRSLEYLAGPAFPSISPDLTKANLTEAI